MRESGRVEGRSRGGCHSHQDGSAFVRLFIISLYRSLDHHNTTAMLEECSNPQHTHAQRHTHTPLLFCPSILFSSLSDTEGREKQTGKEFRRNTDKNLRTKKHHLNKHFSNCFFFFFYFFVIHRGNRNREIN